jgi:hypothetical protein
VGALFCLYDSVCSVNWHRFDGFLVDILADNSLDVSKTVVKAKDWKNERTYLGRKTRISELGLVNIDYAQEYTLNNSDDLRDYIYTALWHKTTTNTFSFHMFLASASVEEVLGRSVSFLSTLRSDECGDYGFIRSMDIEEMPDAFAIGNSIAGDTAEQMSRNTAWLADMNAKQSFRNHRLRDVFSANIVNRNHLSSPIDGIPLIEWIAQEKCRGVVIPINEHLYCWQVSSGDLDAVRSSLSFSGILLL